MAVAMDMDDILGLQQEKVREKETNQRVASLCELLKSVNLYSECVCGCSQAAVCFCSDEKLL